MAAATISSEKWVLDADLEGQKEEQTLKVRTACVGLDNVAVCRLSWSFARTGISVLSLDLRVCVDCQPVTVAKVLATSDNLRFGCGVTR